MWLLSELDLTDRVERIAVTMSVPELSTLGSILREPERPARDTWTEQRLWDRGLIKRWEYSSKNGKVVFISYEATPRGAQVYQRCP